MLTTNAINGMLDVLDEYLEVVTLVEDTGNDINLGSLIILHSGKRIGYTNPGDKSLGISWNSAINGSKSIVTSADSNPIMFAVKSGKTATHLVFYSFALGIIHGIDKLEGVMSNFYYINDGPFYVYDYKVEMEASE